MRRWGQALWQLSVGLVPEYIATVAALGAVRTWLFPVVNPVIGHSLWLMILLAIAGTLFVIPTAGQIPIVQTLMSFGLRAGGAGVLLITLPPVSLPSLVMVSRVVPATVLALVVLSVLVLGSWQAEPHSCWTSSLSPRCAPAQIREEAAHEYRPSSGNTAGPSVKPGRRDFARPRAH